jgi:hypothetical protein
LISGTQSSSRTLRRINMHESTNMYAQESVKSPRIMSSVHRSVEVAVDAFQCSGSGRLLFKGSKAYSIEGETAKVWDDGFGDDYGGGSKNYLSH